MADFLTALKITANNEGGYSFDKFDHGGETYAGIARNYWPNWQGWKIIDEFKGQPKFISIVNSSSQLQQFAQQFYKTNFWDVNKLDQINDQQIANNVYDFGVNSGISEAAKVLQRVVGVTQDGIIGNITINTVNNAVPEQVYNEYNSARSDFYHALALKPNQGKFLKSWLSRLKPYVQ